MNYQILADCVGKQRNTVAKFFSRKKLSIKKPDDVKKYLDYLRTGKQWRESDYKAPHLSRYSFHQQRNLNTFPKKISQQFQNSVFWDRPVESVPKDYFIKRLAQYGTLADIQKMLEVIPLEDIKKIYKNRSELLAEFRKPIINMGVMG
jgi:hypothetical protein